jgi:hypothetical protein
MSMMSKSIWWDECPVGAWWVGYPWLDDSDEGEEALLLYWIVRYFCWCENPLRNFCWWASEPCLLIGQNLMSESYVMIGQSWAVRPYWSELDDWILLEFSCLNRDLWLVRTWWGNSSWDFWLNRVSRLIRLLFLNPTCWLVRTWWLNRTWCLVRVDYVRLWTKTMD